MPLSDVHLRKYQTPAQAEAHRGDLHQGVELLAVIQSWPDGGAIFR